MNLKSTSVSVVQEVSSELVGSALREIRPLLTAIIYRSYAYNYTGIDLSTQLSVAPNETPMRYPKGVKCCCYLLPNGVTLTVKIREHRL